MSRTLALSGFPEWLPAGQIVEQGTLRDIVRKPVHPYARGLLASTIHGARRGERLQTIPGTPPSLDQAPALIDRFAPEHLELALDDPEPLLARINHAGAIFLGRYAPEALGDYIAGPNHVLPTARSARYSSGLGVFDFLKRSSIIEASPAALSNTGPDAVVLAKAEGLDAHALSISLRLDAKKNISGGR
mgnify:CR=1 FL=1